MEADKILENFICGLARTQDHFVIEPILLTNCGHHVCKKCIAGMKKKVICKCGAITERDLSNDKESVAINNMIKVYLKDIFEAIATKDCSQICCKCNTLFESHFVTSVDRTSFNFLFEDFSNNLPL